MDLSLCSEENPSINTFYMLQFIKAFLLDINFESKYVDFTGRFVVWKSTRKEQAHLEWKSFTIMHHHQLPHFSIMYTLKPMIHRSTSCNILLLNKCWAMLHRPIERNRAGLYFRSTWFNNVQPAEWHFSTFNMAWHTVQHLLINTCWTLYHRLKTQVLCFVAWASSWTVEKFTFMQTLTVFRTVSQDESLVSKDKTLVSWEGGNVELHVFDKIEPNSKRTPITGHGASNKLPIRTYIHVLLLMNIGPAGRSSNSWVTWLICSFSWSILYNFIFLH